MHAAAFGLQIEHAELGCVVDVDLGAVEAVAALVQAAPFFFAQVGAADFLGVDFGLRADQTIHQLEVGHFQ